MEISLPSLEILKRYGDELKNEMSKAEELIREVWRRATGLFNVIDEAKRILPEIRAFYTAESLVDINFIVGGARSTLPLTWDASSLRPALVEFARPLILVNSYVYYIQTLITRKTPYLTTVLVHELCHIAFALGHGSNWHGLELELLYRAARNEKFRHELPCLWSYPPIVALEWIKVEALFEAPALWGEELLLENLGFDENLIEKRIRICSRIEKEVGLIIHGERYRSLIESDVEEHVELVKKHWSNVRGKDVEGVYNYVVNELSRMLGEDFMKEFLDYVRGRKAIGCKIVFNPNKISGANINPLISLSEWLKKLNDYGKSHITVE